MKKQRLVPPAQPITCQTQRYSSCDSAVATCISDISADKQCARGLLGKTGMVCVWGGKGGGRGAKGGGDLVTQGQGRLEKGQCGHLHWLSTGAVDLQLVSGRPAIYDTSDRQRTCSLPPLDPRFQQPAVYAWLCLGYTSINTTVIVSLCFWGTRQCDLMAPLANRQRG